MVSNKPSSSCDHSSPRLSLDLLARQMSRLALRSVPLPRACGSLRLVRRYIPSRLGLLLRSHEGTWPGYEIQFPWISMYRVALWDTQISLSITRPPGEGEGYIPYRSRGSTFAQNASISYHIELNPPMQLFFRLRANAKKEM